MEAGGKARKENDRARMASFIWKLVVGLLAVGMLALPLTYGKNLYAEDSHDSDECGVRLNPVHSEILGQVHYHYYDAVGHIQEKCSTSEAVCVVNLIYLEASYMPEESGLAALRRLHGRYTLGRDIAELYCLGRATRPVEEYKYCIRTDALIRVESSDMRGADGKVEITYSDKEKHAFVFLGHGEWKPPPRETPSFAETGSSADLASGAHLQVSLAAVQQQLARGKAFHRAAIATHRAAIATHEEALNSIEAANRQMGQTLMANIGADKGGPGGFIQHTQQTRAYDPCNQFESKETCKKAKDTGVACKEDVYLDTVFEAYEKGQESTSRCVWVKNKCTCEGLRCTRMLP
ncbi:unnamed protein product [Vitrella brassicaformis CCMP3155]|uniref:Uncharacterized protein n=1 Tax=Vitrella brassicaformis (strain CCMP3155) TaxID=1169540 RepID=A0A0G4FM12_VITBC|nr:unnamed protein product [Vitrella brassicaformis CCMP3155]|eukprot:CEM14837.1 unnamed protein product [Vitrella brassicaformis CCMP3155]